MATVRVNGKEITVDDGTLILDAARKAGYDVPTFCYQADLIGVGSCRMCLIEIEGQRKLQPSCITPVLHGMSILTDTPSVVSARSSMLEFLLANHALDCPVCDKGGECELQDMVHKYGPRKGRHAERKFKFHEKDYILSPVIIKNSNRCVQCMKCVRVCREVVGAGVLGAMNRGDHQEPTSFLRSFLDCDQDGNCIEVCPVGCFMRLPYRYKARPWDLKGADTVCPYCATGCRMVVEERDGEALRARAQLGVGINSETFCARGRFGFDYLSGKDRLKAPLVRKGGILEEVSWDEALAAVAQGLAAVGQRGGAIASARLTNEELFLFQKLARAGMRTDNVDSSVRFRATAVEEFIKAAGMNGGGVSVFDLMESDVVLVIGSHLTEENPVVDYIVRRISGSRAMTVAVASPRAMRLDKSARVVIRHEPAAEGELIEALIHTMASAAGADKFAAASGVKDARAKSLKSLIEASGADADAVATLSQRLAAASKVGIIAGTEFLRFPSGIQALKTLRGALKAAGKTVAVLPALDRSNQRGAWEMGALPGLKPGYAPADRRGLDAREMLEAAAAGSMDALYVAGADIIGMHTDERSAFDALSKVKFLVVQETHLTETAKMAHVVLPGGAAAEKDGTLTNQEGRVQRIRPLTAPPGKARRDVDIFGALGVMMGVHVKGPAPSAVFEEIRSEAPSYAQVSLHFVNKKNSHNMLDNKGALVGAVKNGKGGSSASFAPVSLPPWKDYPFKLITGNHLFHSGRLSGRSATLSGLLKEAVVEISAEDAAALGLKRGDKVRVKGREAEAVLTLRTRAGSRKGVAFLPENFDDVRVNAFFSDGEQIARVNISKA